MAKKTTGESMNRIFTNDNNEVIASSSTTVGLETQGSITITLSDAKKINESINISNELKDLIEDSLAMSAKYLN
ncbi:hypothetical protein [Lactococcus lactis]|uniref:hypothetical protein n=1 Tax=Lactococcus lactis TaxID=1358 RepID=UPI00210DCB7D|nr:hypothetical protein [Lactococcus lactis]MCQ4972168.1 hypothetical protein [Lactococcus lactis]MCQ4997974.1 hypothetical protein [Lactococcus lactis]